MLSSFTIVCVDKGGTKEDEISRRVAGESQVRETSLGLAHLLLAAIRIHAAVLLAYLAIVCTPVC